MLKILCAFELVSDRIVEIAGRHIVGKLRELSFLLRVFKLHPNHHENEASHLVFLVVPKELEILLFKFTGVIEKLD